MEVRRATYGAAVRVAVILSAVAAMVALGLDAVGVASKPVLVIAVIVVGFALSWIETGRAERATTRSLGHRVAVVPVRHPVG